MFWMSCFITILQLLVDIDALTSDDRNSLLVSTLFIFGDRACNNEKLRMRCPRGTAISVQWAQYGRPSPSECPPIKRRRKEQQTRRATTTTTTTLQMHFHHRPTSNDSTSSLDCIAPNSLQVVVNLCEDHSHCTVTVSPQLFGSVPCPGAEKILTVGYQCPPKELITETACRGSALEVRCSASKRIALHSAFYGHSPRFNVTECSSQSTSDAVCSSQCTVPTVGRLCLGLRSCNLQVDADVFGNPCQPEINEYLIVVFSCVPVRTLKEIRDSTFPYSKCEDAAATASTTVTASMLSFPLDQLNTTSLTLTSVNASSVPKSNIKSYSEEFLEDVLWTFLFIKENLEKFCLYLSLALCSGALLVLLVIIVRLIIVVFHYRYRIQQLKLIERSQTERTRGPSEGETIIERSFLPSPQPERPRREGGARDDKRMTSSPDSPAFDYIWDSPVFVHVESPHESPVLGHHPVESPLEGPTWGRGAPAADASPSPVPMSAGLSLVWQLPEHPTPDLQSSPSVPCSPVPQTVDGSSRPLGEHSQPLSMFYTNPFRHDPNRTERRSRSVRPSHHRLPFDFR